MRLRIWFMVLFFVGYSGVALAGAGNLAGLSGLRGLDHFAGIDSGGGKLSHYEHNPWYLENTEELRVCITSAAEFGVEAHRLRELVRESFQEWKIAFASNTDSYYQQDELKPYSQVRLATQSLVLTCDNPMLSIQFGTLSADQQKYFDDPRNYVAAAVRTAYDMVQLSSEGFIYVAPLRGSLRPFSENLDSDAWSVGNHVLLKFVLMHELGHVFGVGHMEGHFLMHAGTPELLIAKDFVGGIKSGDTWLATELSGFKPLSIFKPRTVGEFSGCGAEGPVWLADTAKQILGFSLSARCSQLRFGSGKQVEIFESDGSGKPWYRVGELSAKEYGVNSQEPLIQVRLPPQQEVFHSVPDEVKFTNATLFGEIRTLSEFWRGLYLPDNGAPQLGMEIEVHTGNHLESSVVTPDLIIHRSLIVY